MPIVGLSSAVTLGNAPNSQTANGGVFTVVCTGTFGSVPVTHTRVVAWIWCIFCFGLLSAQCLLAQGGAKAFVQADDNACQVPGKQETLAINHNA